MERGFHFSWLEEDDRSPDELGATLQCTTEQSFGCVNQSFPVIDLQQKLPAIGGLQHVSMIFAPGRIKLIVPSLICQILLFSFFFFPGSDISLFQPFYYIGRVRVVF